MTTNQSNQQEDAATSAAKTRWEFQFRQTMANWRSKKCTAAWARRTTAGSGGRALLPKKAIYCFCGRRSERCLRKSTSENGQGATGCCFLYAPLSRLLALPWGTSPTLQVARLQ